MSKKIEITYGGEKYVLEFTKETVRQMESAGFNIRAAIDTPLSSIEMLFTGAFLANHGRAVKNKIPEKIMKDGLPREMFGRLVEMYNEPLEALFDKEDTDEGNLEWGANW